MTTWTDSMISDSMIGDSDRLLSGYTLKLGVLAAGVGIAFGVGMALGGQGGPGAPAPAPTAAGLLAAADARTNAHEEVKTRLGFHEALVGHPSTEGVQVTVKAPEPAPTAAVKVAAKHAPVPPPVAPVVTPPAPAPAAPPAKVAKASAPEDALIEEEEGVDALDDDMSALERKTERKDNMAHLRSALLKVLGDDTPVWSEDHTPPSLRSQRKGSESIASASAPQKIAVKPAPAKVTPPAKPLPKKVVATESHFAVQIASIAERAGAETVAAELRKMGKRVRVVTADVGGKPVHRVQITGFASRDAASAEKERLGRGFVVAE